MAGRQVLSHPLLGRMTGTSMKEKVSLWTGCYGLVVMNGYYGLVAMEGCYGLVAMDGRYGGLL